MAVIILCIPKIFLIFDPVKIRIIVDDSFQDLFKITGNRKKVKIGHLLIAEPFLEGDCFSRSVIFVVEHDQEGSVGFILNKPLAWDISELVGGLSSVHIPIYLGGPVEKDQLYYLHRYPTLTGAQPIAHSIYGGGEFEELKQLLRAGKIHSDEIRFFLGYSGWGKGQLDRELEENSWMVGEITQKQFFELPNPRIWESSMKALGGRYQVWANFPEDPNLN